MTKDRPSAASLLLSAAADAELLRDERADAYARVPDPDQGGHRLLRLRSRDFRLWLARRYDELTGQPPSPSALSSISFLLEARAQESPRQTFWNRVARGKDGAIWLDLADTRLVRINAQGFTLSREAPPIFRRFSHQQPLPAPARKGDLRRMDAFLNFQDEDDLILYYTSLVTALIPDIPQPLLILLGPQGAAKTTIAVLRRRLIDPSVVDEIMMRREVAEIMQALNHHYLPILDNMAKLSALQEVVICLASTGGGFTKRALYSDEDDVIFRVLRQVTITAITLPSQAPDFLDRALLIELERILPRGRQAEWTLWRRFEQQRPELLAGLLEVLVETMRIEPKLQLAELGRMADFTRWGTAAAIAMGFGAERFREAMARNEARQIAHVVEDDPLAEAVQVLAQQRPCFSGSATELLSALQEVAGPLGLPRDPAELGRRLNQMRPALAELGVLLRSERQNGGHRQRRWIVERPGAEGVALH